MLFFVFVGGGVACAEVFSIYCSAVVGLSSAALSPEYFSRKINQQPIAIFDIPEPSDTGKALVEFYMDMKTLGSRGIHLPSPSPGEEPVLHKAFLKGHLADGVAR